ncbi:cysteine rich repeat-containing protein [Pseudomonas sp. NA-150]|uniref:cysteine rich repeat-containing protein n=1 Tax=Pseudomonas sp. NA-150 TaxID=3367525 RepID=UPI0037C9FD42
MNMQSRFFKALAFTALAFAGTSQAFAAGSLMQDCRPDYKKFCSSVGVGGGHITECLKQHKTELSPACATDLLSKVESRLAR